MSAGHQLGSIDDLLAEAQRHYADGNIIEAFNASEKALKLSKHTNANAAYMMGAALSKIPRIKAATKLMISALRINPNHVPAAVALARFLAGTGQETDALLFLEGRGLKDDNDLRETFLGIALESCAGVAALDILEAQPSSLPSTSQMHYALAHAAGALQQWQEAAKHLETARTVNTGEPPDDLMQLVARTLAKSLDCGQGLAEKISESTGVPSNSPEVTSEIVRYRPISEIDLDSTAWPAVDAEWKGGSTAHTDFSRRLWKDAAPPSGTWALPPAIQCQPLVDNLRRLLERTSKLKVQGAFQLATDNVAEIRERFAPSADDPILVMSTGRCGTKGLHLALTTSPKVLPFHSMPWRLMPGDRNHLLYRLITGNLDLDVLEQIFKTYLECRTAELISAYGRNMTPMLINHWDTIFAPLLEVLFPKARYLYLHRDEQSVTRSILGKNQWRNRQLQYWRFDPGFPEGRFLFDQAPGVPLEANVAWYLHVTKTLAEAFCDVVAAERFAAFESERLFKLDPDEIERLSHFLPEGAADAASLRTSFSEKRNDKTIMQEVSEEDLDRSAELTAKHLDRLRATGTLDA